MTRARDLADSADKDIAGTLTLDGLTVDGTGTFSNNSNENLFIADTANTTRSSLQISGAVNYFNANIDTASHGQFVWRSSNAYTERMRINSSGNIGIGTSSPLAKLQIKTQTNGNAAFQNSTSETGGVKINAFNDAGNASVPFEIDGSSLQFNIASVEKMRIDSSGNVGIGTDSPSQKLHVSSSSAIVGLLESTGSSAARLYFDNTGMTTAGNTQVWAQNNDLAFNTNGSEAMRIDSSGNVGIGVAPSAWRSTTDAIQFGQSGSISSNNNANAVSFTSNAYISSGSSNIRISTGKATNYYQYDGAHVWDYAGSGAAGTTISYSEAMRIDSSGNVGIGTVSPDVFSRSYSGTTTGISSASGETALMLNSSGTNVTALEMGRAGTRELLLYDTSTTSQLYTLVSKPFIFGTNGTEAMRIDSSGNVGIGASTVIGKLHVDDSSGATMTLTRTAGATSGNLGKLRFGNINVDSALASIVAIQDGATNNSAITFGTQTSGAAEAERMRIDSSGNILSQYGSTTGYAQNSGNGGMTFINDTGSAGGSLILTNSAHNGWSNIYMNRFDWASGHDTRLMQFTVNGSGVAGSITVVNATSIAYSSSSDYRLKTDVQPMTGATDRLKQLNPVNFEWIVDGTRVDGFLAHEAQAVVPQSVTGSKDAMRDEEYEVTPAVTDDDGNVVTEAVMGTRSVPDYQGIDQSKLVPLLVATIQELEARIAALENA